MRPQKLTSWFWNALDSLEQPLFTADLKHAEPGSYDFGWVDQSKYKGQITYVPADNSSGYWGTQVGGFAVGKNGRFSGSSFAAVLGRCSLFAIGVKGVGLCRDVSLTRVLDTATSFFMISDDILTAYYSQVPGSENSDDDGGYVYPCNVTLPSISFRIGGHEAVIPGDGLTFEDLGDGSTFHLLVCPASLVLLQAQNVECSH